MVKKPRDFIKARTNDLADAVNVYLVGRGFLPQAVGRLRRAAQFAAQQAVVGMLKAVLDKPLNVAVFDNIEHMLMKFNASQQYFAVLSTSEGFHYSIEKFPDYIDMRRSRELAPLLVNRMSPSCHMGEDVPDSEPRLQTEVDDAFTFNATNASIEMNKVKEFLVEQQNIPFNLINASHYHFVEDLFVTLMGTPSCNRTDDPLTLEKLKQEVLEVIKEVENFNDEMQPDL